VTKRIRATRGRPPRPPACPLCAAVEVIPIVRGFPSVELFERAEAGEVALGGCVIGQDDPEWHCKSCGKDFGRVASRQMTPRNASRPR